MHALNSVKTNYYFTKGIDKYFLGWILRNTWHTGHPNDERMFYEFVDSVHRFSNRVGGKAGMGKYIIDDEGHFETTDKGVLIENGHRNPRTHDKELFESNIIAAVRKNAPFDEERLQKLATRYADRAMDILEFLWCKDNSICDPRTLGRPQGPDTHLQSNHVAHPTNPNESASTRAS